MNEWVVRFWGCVALAALIALIATTALHDHEHESQGVTSMPPQPVAIASLPPGIPVTRASGRLVDNRPITPNPEASLSAFHALFRSSDSGLAQRMLDTAHLRLGESAKVAPEAMRAADVLLLRGLNAVEVELLLLRHQLDYLACEAKTPLPDGTVMTMISMSGRPFPRLPLSIAELVESDIGRARHRFLWQAQQATNPVESARQRDIALSPEIGIYRIEVVGRQRDLVALLGEPDVRGVVAEVDGARAAEFARLKSEMPRTIPPIVRTRIRLDGTQVIPPPPDLAGSIESNDPR